MQEIHQAENLDERTSLWKGLAHLPSTAQYICKTGYMHMLTDFIRDTLLALNCNCRILQARTVDLGDVILSLLEINTKSTVIVAPFPNNY